MKKTLAVDWTSRVRYVKHGKQKKLVVDNNPRFQKEFKEHDYVSVQIVLLDRPKRKRG